MFHRLIYLSSLLMVQTIAIWAGEYTCERRESLIMYSEKGDQIDSAQVNLNTQLSVENDKEKSIITIQKIDLQVDGGRSALGLNPKIISMQNEIEEATDRIRKVSVQLDKNQIIGDFGKGLLLKATTWPDFLKRIRENLSSKELSFPVALPVSLLIRRIPFLIYVDPNVKVGDFIDIPLREHKEGQSFSSSERAVELLCVKRKNNVAHFESNVEKGKKEDMWLTWHVRIAYNMKKQKVRHIKEKRFSRIRQEATDKTQVRLETIELRPLTTE